MGKVGGAKPSLSTKYIYYDEDKTVEQLRQEEAMRQFLYWLAWEELKYGYE